MPVLILKDMMKLIELLVKFRETHGIKRQNPFLFAVRSSDSRASDWHAVNEISGNTGVIAVNATQNRHRVSTIYASYDINP